MGAGAGLTVQQFEAVASAWSPGTVFADWLVLSRSDTVWLSLRSLGQAPQFYALPGSAEAAVEAARHLSGATANTLLQGGALAELAWLVQPLRDQVPAGACVVLCPDAALAGIPLHALPVGDQPLVLRYPCVYLPNLTVLHHCMHTSAATFPEAAGVASLSSQKPSSEMRGECLSQVCGNPMSMPQGARCRVRICQGVLAVGPTASRGAF